MYPILSPNRPLFLVVSSVIPVQSSATGRISLGCKRAGVTHSVAAYSAIRVAVLVGDESLDRKHGVLMADPCGQVW